MIDYIQLFKDRNLFNQCTNEIELNNLLNKKKIIFYIGFDATADALHAGSLVQLRAIKTLIKHGHQAIVLLGGGTTKIGDPSGKDASRQILTYETIQKNIENFKRIFEPSVCGVAPKLDSSKAFSTDPINELSHKLIDRVILSKLLILDN